MKARWFGIISYATGVIIGVSVMKGWFLTAYGLSTILGLGMGVWAYGIDNPEVFNEQN